MPIYACAPNVLQHITGYHLHRGCVACFRRKPLLSVDDVLPDARNILVCEGIMNPTNMGVILAAPPASGSTRSSSTRRAAIRCTDVQAGSRWARPMPSPTPDSTPSPMGSMC
ncbi:MAG: hypothetical protein R2710_20350 [Acidimicrobiales bacterium]